MPASSQFNPAGDPGGSAVRSIFEFLSIDDYFSIWGTRGFRWWGDQHGQEVWSEPGIDDDGITVYRLRARTDLLRDFRPSPEHLDLIAQLNTLNVLSALVFDPAT